MDLRIEPLTWHWDEWRQIYQQVETRKDRKLKENRPDDIRVKVAGIIAISREWHADIDAYIATLGEPQRKNVVDLLLAECSMLWEIIDPSDGQRSQRDFHEFRTRWFMASALERFVDRHKFDRVDHVVAAYRALERYAIDSEWLP